MGMTYTATLTDGTEREMALYDYDPALLFANVAHLLEEYVEFPYGISYDEELDEMFVDTTLFITFFKAS